MLRANNQDYYNNGRSPLDITCDFEVEGNMMSMFDKTNFSGITEIPSGFSSSMQIFFKKRARLISAKNLLLPATALTYGCYSEMFAGCSNLKEGPKLPATTLTENCYYGMFSGCTSLIEAPELPATTLASSCYQSMFNGCTSLTSAPELPAPLLKNYCYKQMFRGCTSLTQAPELLATDSQKECYCEMFYGCTNLNYIKCLRNKQATDDTDVWVAGVASSGTFVKNPNFTGWSRGTSGIPTNWTVQDAS